MHQVEVVAVDATLLGVRLLTEPRGAPTPLPLNLGSMKLVDAVGAPEAFEAARGEQGPAVFRVRGPCLLSAKGGLLRLLVQVPTLRMLATLSVLITTLSR